MFCCSWMASWKTVVCMRFLGGGRWDGWALTLHPQECAHSGRTQTKAAHIAVSRLNTGGGE